MASFIKLDERTGINLDWVSGWFTTITGKFYVTYVVPHEKETRYARYMPDDQAAVFLLAVRTTPEKPHSITQPDLLLTEALSVLQQILVLFPSFYKDEMTEQELRVRSRAREVLLRAINRKDLL